MSDSAKNCPTCGKQEYRKVKEDYIFELQDGNELKIPDLEFSKCTACGETGIPPGSMRKIREMVAELTEQISPEELEKIREELDIQNQDDMSEILGLGAKTYGRWERGTQQISRSMGYYLRILRHFPEVFAWLKNRGWKNTDQQEGMISGPRVRFSGDSSVRVSTGGLKPQESISYNPCFIWGGAGKN